MPNTEPPLRVASLRGRWHGQPHGFCSQSLEITVTEIEPRVVSLRLTDRDAMEFWVHLVLELKETP